MNASSSPPSVLPGSKYRWWVVFMLWFVCFFNYADRQAISSVFPSLKAEFGFDPVQLGLIGSAFMWVYALAAPVAGLAADRAPRKTLILAACVVWSFFTLGTAACGVLWSFVLVRALTGLGETFYFPSAMSLLSDYHDRRTRSQAMSWHQSSVYAGTILGSWLAASMAERWGWRLPFYFFGPLGILLAAVLMISLREPPRSRPEPGSSATADPEKSLSIPQTLGVIFRAPVALLLMLGFLGANFVATIFLTWTPMFLIEKFHYSISGAGLSGTVYIHCGSALAVPCAGLLADRLTRRLPTGRMAVQLVGLVFGSVFVLLVGTTNSTATLVAAMAMFGICKGFYDSGIFASLYDAIEPRARGTAAGLMNTVGWGGGALGPLFVGYVTKYGSKPTPWENMSDAIAWCGAAYLFAAFAVLAAMFLLNRGTRRARGVSP